MSPEVINGLFSIGTAVIGFIGGIIVANMGNKKQESKDLKDRVRQLANDVISYSKVESDLLGELKQFTGRSKKDLKADCYLKLFGDRDKQLTNENQARGIIDKLI